MNRLMVGVGIILLAATTSPLTAEPVAFLMGIEGVASIRRAGSSGWDDAKLSVSLFRGDRLRVVSGSATVLLQSGQTETIGAGGTRSFDRVAGSAGSVGPLARLWKAFLGRATLAAETRDELSRPGAVRKPRGRIDVVSPCNTALLSPPREVVWIPEEGVEECEVSVRDASGRSVWSGSTPGSRIDLTGVRLEPDVDYLLTVRSVDGGRPASDQVFFRLLSKKDREKVQQELRSVEKLLSGKVDPEGLALSRGEIYRDWVLLEDAMKTYRAAGVDRTGHPELVEARNLLYVKNGRRWAIATP